jgi:nucleotide-binding universal stress UspA family protein
MESVVVGCTGSDASRAAVEWAANFAREVDAEVIAAYAVSTAQEWELAALQINTDPLRRELEQLLRGEWTAPLRDAGVQYHTKVITGRPANALMQLARDEHAALIVVGMGRHGTMSELLIGSVSKSLLHEALRPVVAVPPMWAASIEHTRAHM